MPTYLMDTFIPLTGHRKAIYVKNKNKSIPFNQQSKGPPCYMAYIDLIRTFFRKSARTLSKIKG